MLATLQCEVYLHVNYLTQYNGTSVNFRIQQVDVYSDQNECYLEYCLIRPSNEQCTNYKMCNFTLPVVYLALYNISEKSLLLQWTPVSQQTGDLIISNYKVGEHISITDVAIILYAYTRKTLNINMRYFAMDLKL